MNLRPFKFVVQAVALEIDDDGAPVGERIADPVTLYGLEAMRDFADSFAGELAAAESLNGSVNVKAG